MTSAVKYSLTSEVQVDGLERGSKLPQVLIAKGAGDTKEKISQQK